MEVRVGWVSVSVGIWRATAPGCCIRGDQVLQTRAMSNVRTLYNITVIEGIYYGLTDL